MPALPDVAWNRIAGFVRQHTHDLRNELNGIDLETALLADLVDDGEARESVARIRAEIRQMAAGLRQLSAKFAEPKMTPMRIAAQELFLIWQDQLVGLPGLEIAWDGRLGGEEVEVDPGAFAMAFRELLVNAHAFAPPTRSRLRAGARGADGVTFELHEPKSEAVDPADWGRTPLVSTRRGGYGLGLCVLCQTLEANGSTVRWRYDPAASELVTTISIPLAS
jgi:hypothetical protein